MTQTMQDIRPRRSAPYVLTTYCARRHALPPAREQTYYRTLTPEPGQGSEGHRQQADAEPLLFTLDEAAQMLRISKWKLYDYIHNRQLRTVKFGSRRLVPAAALHSLVDQLAGQEGA